MVYNKKIFILTVLFVLCMLGLLSCASKAKTNETTTKEKEEKPRTTYNKSWYDRIITVDAEPVVIDPEYLEQLENNDEKSNL